MGDLDEQFKFDHGNKYSYNRQNWKETDKTENNTKEEKIVEISD